MMKEVKFAAGVTLYNPTKDELDNIALLGESFERIFLFDNSEPGYKKPTFVFDEKFEVLTENRNQGLPYAFNAIVARCTNFDFLCTLDQDSKFSPLNINKIKQYITTLDSEIGVVAPFVDYGYEKIQPCDKTESKSWVITSGSFVNLKVLRKENIRYDENYFIDKFEIDLCEQLRNRKYPILMFYGSTLHQSLGEENGHRHSNHGVIRHYYLFRNRFYFNNKWHKGFKKYYLNILQTARHLYLILMYEEHKTRKIKTLHKAFRDYKEGRMGKLFEQC